MEERSREILGWNKVQKRGRIYHIKKGLLVMGYINDVSKFDKSVGDFDALLQRVRFEDQNRLFPIDPAASATPAGSSSAAPAPSSSR